MLFNSYEFLFLFLPAVLLIYYFFAETQRNFVLTLSGYVFYAYWDYRFCTLLFISTLWDYLLGKKIFNAETEKTQKAYLFLSLFLNLSLLVYFKYFNFFIQSFVAFIPFFSVKQMQIILPVGISFFTFQSMSYSIDIYRKKAEPVKNFLDFACYISMFPQLIAGPIVRYNQIAQQLYHRSHTPDRIALGIRRFIIGLSKKVLVADSLAMIADEMFLVSTPNMGIAWLGAISFSLQIYFDFSGYSDMAIGLGRLFGFELPENFNFPYQASGFSDFWRRWHMSLSYWLRDYLFFSLGGSKGTSVGTAINVMITMLLCGLWHGAAWTFVIWGGYHGLLLLIERPFRKHIARAPKFLAMVMTYLLVVFGWVFFRSVSLSQAIKWIMAMFGIGEFSQMTVLYPPLTSILFMAFVQISCFIVPPRKSLDFSQPIIARDLAYIVLFLSCTIIILGKNVSPFIYFQF